MIKCGGLLIFDLYSVQPKHVSKDLSKLSSIAFRSDYGDHRDEQTIKKRGDRAGSVFTATYSLTGDDRLIPQKGGDRSGLCRMVCA